MAWDKFKSIKIWLRIQRLLWLFFFLAVGLYLTKNYWQPPYYNWRCAGIAAELAEKCDIVVRYGDPTEFFVPPLRPLVDIPEKGFFIERSDVRYALTALQGVRDAISKYPSGIIKKTISAVFISGTITSYNVQIGGSYFNKWIYLSALEKYEQAGIELYALNFHHELSSLLVDSGGFPSKRWQAVNASDFIYLTRQIDVVHSAAQENRRDLQEASKWYAAGFVHDYGMSSMENDFNMYAELAMTHPQRLKDLSQKYPKIKAKTKILVEYYTSLAPELGEYFKSVGLADNAATE